MNNQQPTKQQLLEKLAQTQKNLHDLKNFFESQKNVEGSPLSNDMIYDACFWLKTSDNWSLEIVKIINRNL